jgi:hypothetical protein
MRELFGILAPGCEGATGRSDGSGRTVGRRRVLGSVAAAATVGSTLATGRARAAKPNAVPKRLADTFGTVVNVAEAGADRDGKRSINGVLEEVRADDTLLYFPSGKYYMDRQFRFTGFENFGLYGNDATLIPANYHDNADGKHKLFRLGTHYAPGERAVVENFTVDFRADDTGVRAFEIAASDELVVRDVDIVGRHDSGMWGPGRFVVTDPDGEGLVERFRAPGGGEWSENTPSSGTLWRGPTGIICNDYNRGSMKFRRCHLGGFPDNGLYAGDTEGPVTVESGYYENSNGNNVRVGGPHPVVRWVTVVVDETTPEANAHRGIRLQNTDSATVEGCDITIAVPVEGSTGVKVMDGCTGHTLIRDTRIEMRGDGFNNAVEVSPNVERFKAIGTTVVQDTDGGSAFVLEGTGDDDWGRIVDCDIRGTPGHRYNRSAIYNTRNNVEFRGVRVDQGGGRKRRALENFASDCLLYECDFQTCQYPVIDDGTGTWVSYNRFESTDDHAGYFLTDDSEDVYLKANHIANGIRDDGCEGLRKAGNTVE